MSLTTKNICFITPGPDLAPVGGYKVVYEYANRFARAGWDVTIANPITFLEESVVKALLRHPRSTILSLVGGLTGFITFINGILAASLSRFYAYSVGEASREETAESGLENCRQWFSIGVMIHTVVPLILLAIGYPIGE